MSSLPDPTSELQQQSQSLRRQLAWSWLLMILLVAVILLPTLKLWFNFGVSGDPRPVTPRGALADFEQTTVNLFRETSPSVVYITTKTLVRDRWTRRVGEVESGTGSGFVWDDQGHIVTNFHVVQDSSSAQVVFYDQTTFEAERVGASPDHDLAVLRISAPKSMLRPVLVGESQDLQVGQSVYAIGNPFGLHQTLTTGVISAKSRSIESPSGRAIDDAIQIDAAINPGNSGGPLLDSAGRLIGVNTAIYSPSGASAGVGFSVPVDTVNRIVPQIIKEGDYAPVTLGITTDMNLNQVLSARYGIEGVIVFDVLPGSAASDAGLRSSQRNSRGEFIPGDILTHIDRRPVESVNDIKDALQHYDHGDTITVTCIRDEGESQITVVLK